MDNIKYINSPDEIFNICMYDNLSVIYGLNESGKSKLLKEMSLGFKGSLKNKFTFNDEVIDYDMFQVVYIEEIFDIQNYLKITKSNPLRDEILKFINFKISVDINYQKLAQNIDIVNSELSLILTDFFTLENDEFYDNLNLKGKLNFKSYETLIDKLLKIELIKNDNVVDENNLTKFEIRMLIIKILKSYIDYSDSLRQVVFLFDMPDACADIKNLYKFNNFIKQLLIKEAKIIICTNNSQAASIFVGNLKQLNVLKNRKIYNFKKSELFLKNSIILFSFIQSKEKDLITYKNKISSIINDNDYVDEELWFLSYCLNYCLIILLFDKVTLIESDISNIEYINEIEVKCKLTQRMMVFIYNAIEQMGCVENIEINATINFLDIIK